MGQRIEVSSTAIGDVALFDLDRSLTGQDSESFTEMPESPHSPPSLLAQRIFASDDNVSHVHVLSNSVSVTRDHGWTEDSIAAASDLIADLFIHYRTETPDEIAQRLRDENYNATISFIREQNPDLWVIRVRPDEPIDPFEPGQYTTLALGYWEPRTDGTLEDFEADPNLRHKMVRRSYSVSSSMVNDSGSLVDPHPNEVEFYIVRVDASPETAASLTSRIFAKGVGDRIYLGRKFTGRYTLATVDPDDTCIFLSTGTGEAPQNQMVAELLRRNHRGRILAAVCVRYRHDLAYMDQNAALEERFSNYSYLTLTTREPENEGNKVYIQDLLESGRLEEELGFPLDPANTHVFLCGNPDMIGIPDRDEETGELTFPDSSGVCQLLHERGFKIDHRRDPGNVHYEEYW